MWTFHGTVCSVHVLTNLGNTKVNMSEHSFIAGLEQVGAVLLLFPAWEKKNIQYSCEITTVCVVYVLTWGRVYMSRRYRTRSICWRQDPLLMCHSFGADFAL